ncbi:hypothetical protein Mapa_015311 [Marchantia paleacea]|nr:hypothetical protein Mapa_015311 [Marchantia paleacea]
MSFFGILFCYISFDFSNYNVFTNSNANAPLFYKISVTWSNHEGSMLLWCWILRFYRFLFCYLAQPYNIPKQAKGVENKNISFLFLSKGLDQHERAVSLIDEQKIYKRIALFFLFFYYQLPILLFEFHLFVLNHLHNQILFYKILY